MALRQIRSLVYQFAVVSHGLSAHDMAKALDAAGLIELIDSNHYRELPSMRKIPEDEFKKTIGDVFANYRNSKK